MTAYIHCVPCFSYIRQIEDRIAGLLDAKLMNKSTLTHTALLDIFGSIEERLVQDLSLTYFEQLKIGTFLDFVCKRINLDRIGTGSGENNENSAQVPLLLFIYLSTINSKLSQHSF